jgi:hypothetical protein
VQEVHTRVRESGRVCVPPVVDEQRGQSVVFLGGCDGCIYIVFRLRLTTSRILIITYSVT